MMMKKISILLLITMMVLVGCTVADSEFSRDLLIANQTIEQEESQVVAEPTTTERRKVTLATGDWAPYVGENIPGQGFSSEIIIAAFNEVDVDVELEFFPWARAFELVESGEMFGTYPWSFTEERKATFAFSVPVATSAENLYYMAGNPAVPEDFTGFSPISDLRFGGVDTFSHVDIMEAEGVTVDIASNEVDALNKLMNDRIDLMPGNPLVFQDLIKEHYPDQINAFDFLRTPILSTDMGIIVSKNYPDQEELLQLFAQGMARLRAKGEYDNILIRNGFEFLIVEDDGEMMGQVTDYGHLGKLVIATGEWAPYVGEGLDDQGFTTEIITKAFDKVGVDVEIKFFPWTKAMEEVKAHNAAGTYPWSMTDERKETFLFTSPLTVSETKLMYMTDNTSIPGDYDDLADLNNLKFGGAEEYSYLVEFESRNMDVDLSTSETDAIKKLYNGRFDLLPTTPLVAIEFINSEWPGEVSKFKFMKKPLQSLDMGMLVDKAYPNADEVVEAFNVGINLLRESGEYNDILTKHGFDFLIAD